MPELPPMWSRTRIHTVTFRYPKEFITAFANSLGRTGDQATHAEIEEFLREAIRVNIQAVLDEFGSDSSTKRKKLYIKKKR